jgi:hypothetical protein
MCESEGNTAKADAYAATLKSITKIPPQLFTIFKGQDVVSCLKGQHRSFVNEIPFNFSEENDHVWQVLDALKAVLDNDYVLFTKGTEGDGLNIDIFGDFVSLANELRESEGVIKQLWIVVFLHDIAKYSVQNADHAHISGSLVKDLFKTNHFGLTAQERDRIAWVIGNHDVVGNIVSSAERAPRCLTEGLEGLSDEEMQVRLKMLIVLSLCDLRGTRNGKFVNDDNAKSRFLAAELGWLKSKEENLFSWRIKRLVRAHEQENTKEKQKLWDETFSVLRKETKSITENQIGKNIKVFTNLLYLALGLTGRELAKLFVIVSLMAEMSTEGKPNLNFQVDFTKGADRGGSGPIISGFEIMFKEIMLGDLTPAKITANYNKKDQTIYSIPISYDQNHLTIDSKKIGDDWLRNEEERSSKA